MDENGGGADRSDRTSSWVIVLRPEILRANRHLVTLRAALNRAWREGLTASNDAWTRVQFFPGVERQRLRFLEIDEAQRLLNACSPDLRPLVQLALLTGARYGELCRLQVGDFQAVSGTLFIRDRDRDLHRRPFKEAVIRAGLDPEFTFHELRHTWASLTIMAGAPLIVVAKNLGHADTRMVERHYGHLAHSYEAEVVRKSAPSFGLVSTGKIVPLLGSTR